MGDARVARLKPAVSRLELCVGHAFTHKLAENMPSLLLGWRWRIAFIHTIKTIIDPTSGSVYSSHVGQCLQLPRRAVSTAPTSGSPFANQLEKSAQNSKTRRPNSSAFTRGVEHHSRFRSCKLLSLEGSERSRPVEGK
eukprot:1793613-Pleurochrysis_carterae.AAC.1